jgi:hypothetical protein
MATIEERVAKLEEKLKQAKALKAQIEARQRAIDTKKSRADDTRRKVLVGAMFLELADASEAAKNELWKKLDGFLIRPNDRALFNLATKDTLPGAPSSEGEKK